MDTKNLGYGIAGKKNVYSSKILLDNWVEDGYGSYLHALAKTASDRITDQHYITTQRASHIDPALMSYHPNILKAKIESAEAVMTRNKEGMPYDLLFSYTTNNNGRFQSTFQANQIAASNANHQSFAKVDGTVRAEKQKEVRRELKDMQTLRSESNYANRRVDAGPNELLKAGGDHSVIPNFSRTAQISEWFTHANIPINYRRS